MQLEAIYHHPKQQWSCAYDKDTIIIRIRTKRDDVHKVSIITGDKYDWDRTKKYIPLSKMTSDSMFDYFSCEVQPPYRRLRYAFLLEDGEESIWMDENNFLEEEPDNPDRMFEFPYINGVDVFTPPAWVKDAIFYQIFPERFANGDKSNDPENVLPWGGKPERDNFFGGDLQGVIDHLDYLSELGITAIYFTPIFEATTNHKYDTEDYMRIDPHFGDADTLKKLVKQCHKRGIRVLLDAVFNHSGRTFKPFVDLQKNGEQSKYKDWFYIRSFPIEVVDGIPSYETFSFEPLMPKLNTENPEVKEYLLNVAEYWIKEIGVDGWRLDVANEVDHEFWREFRHTVKKVNPDAYILGEVWNDASPWLQGDQFDAAMNYPFTNAVVDFFIKDEIDAYHFANSIGRQLSRYSLQATEVAFNLLDSHDTPRLLTLSKGDKRKMKLAALFQFTYIGTPCIYYGDEIGMDGEHDPGCRKCMEWDESKQDRELFTYYQHLIELRKSHPALRTGSIHFLEAEQDGKKLAYARKDENETIVILTSTSEDPESFAVQVDGASYLDLLSGNEWPVTNGKLNMELPPFGYAVLKSV